MEKAAHLKVLSTILSMLEPLDGESRRRVLETVLTFFSDDLRKGTNTGTWDAIDVNKIPSSSSSVPFSQRLEVSPKDFVMQKAPKTDVERIACLGFYLTQYRDTPYFKTTDLNALNTEAAQPKFSNPAQAVANATKYGYLAPAVKGNKQISGQGEQFVIALPDRDLARAAMANRPRRNRNRAKAAPSLARRPKVLGDVQASTRKARRS